MDRFKGLGIGLVVIILLCLGFAPRIIRNQQIFDAQLRMQSESEKPDLNHIRQKISERLGVEVRSVQFHKYSDQPALLKEDIEYARTLHDGFSPPGKENACLRHILAGGDVKIMHVSSSYFQGSAIARTVRCMDVQQPWNNESKFVDEAVLLPPIRHTPGVLATILAHEFVHICQFREGGFQPQSCDNRSFVNETEESYVKYEFPAYRMSVSYLDHLLLQGYFNEFATYDHELENLYSWTRYREKFQRGEFRDYLAQNFQRITRHARK